MSSRRSLQPRESETLRISEELIAQLISKVQLQHLITEPHDRRSDEIPHYQVFINFRGSEMRGDGKFLEILVKALRKEKVNVFVDKDETKGKDLTALYDRIKNSKIAVTIFSDKYTESSWCLNELVEIKKCADQGSLQVIPIFFNLKTADVKYLAGNFGDNFRKLERKYPKSSNLPAEWKEALMFVSQKFGLSSGTCRFQRGIYNMLFGNNNRYLREFAKLITKDVKKVLADISKREEEEERIKKIREKQELLKAEPNSLLAKTQGGLITNVVPGGILVLLGVMFVAPYVLLIIFLSVMYNR